MTQRRRRERSAQRRQFYLMARTQALQGDSLAGLSRHQAGNGARGELRACHSGAPLQRKAPAGRQAAAAAALRQVVAAGRGQPRLVLLPCCFPQWRKPRRNQSGQGGRCSPNESGGLLTPRAAPRKTLESLPWRSGRVGVPQEPRAKFEARWRCGCFREGLHRGQHLQRGLYRTCAACMRSSRRAQLADALVRHRRSPPAHAAPLSRPCSSPALLPLSNQSDCSYN